VVSCKNTVVAAGTQWWIQELNGGYRNTVVTSGRLWWLQKNSEGCRKIVVSAGTYITYSAGCRKTHWWL